LSQDLSCGSRETLQERLSPAREVEQESRDWVMASREQLCQTGSSSTDSGIQVLHISIPYHTISNMAYPSLLYPT